LEQRIEASDIVFFFPLKDRGRIIIDFCVAMVIGMIKCLKDHADLSFLGERRLLLLLVGFWSTFFRP
jgi:hypothetical protein